MIIRVQCSSTKCLVSLFKDITVTKKAILTPFRFFQTGSTKYSSAPFWYDYLISETIPEHAGARYPTK